MQSFTYCDIDTRSLILRYESEGPPHKQVAFRGRMVNFASRTSRQVGHANVNSKGRQIGRHLEAHQFAFNLDYLQ